MSLPEIELKKIMVMQHKIRVLKCIYNNHIEAILEDYIEDSFPELDEEVIKDIKEFMDFFSN